ncbi:SOS-response transcriptional repressor LexA [Bradyrhizobium sp. USDA 4011]
MTGLTSVQAQCVEFVGHHIEQFGASPSYREIADHLGIRGRGTISHLIDSIVERGALLREPGKARTLSIPEPGIAGGLVVHPLPDVRRAIKAYARQHRISERTAAEEALRAYFMEPTSP